MKIIYLLLRSRLHKFDLPCPAIDAFVRGIVFVVGFGLYGFCMHIILVELILSGTISPERFVRHTDG